MLFFLYRTDIVVTNQRVSAHLEQTSYIPNLPQRNDSGLLRTDVRVVPTMQRRHPITVSQYLNTFPKL